MALVTNHASVDIPTSPEAAGLPCGSLSDRLKLLVERHRYAIFAAVLLLYLACFNGLWRPDPDSALYLTIGRNLALGNGYAYQGQPQHLVFPGLPVALGGLFKIFNQSAPRAALILMLMAGVAALALTYRVFLLHSDRGTALVMTLAMATTRIFYRSCFEILTDLPFLVGVLAFLAGFEAIVHPRRTPAGTACARWFDWVLLIVGLGLAVLMRPVMWALVLSIVAALIVSLLRGNSRRPQILVCFALVIIAAACFYWMDPRRGGGSVAMGDYESEIVKTVLPHFQQFLHRSISEFLPRFFEASAAQAIFGTRIGPGLNSLAGVFVIGATIWLFRVRPLWGIWVFMVLLLMFTVVKPLDRYFLPVLPLLLFAWWRALVWIDHRMSRPWSDRVFLFLLCVGFGTNFARIGQLFVEQHRRPFLQYCEDGTFASLDQVTRLLNSQVAPRSWVLAPMKLGRILTFRSSVYATHTPERLDLDPRAQQIYVLEPAGDQVMEWLKQKGCVVGPQLGTTIQGNRGGERFSLHLIVLDPSAANPHNTPEHR